MSFPAAPSHRRVAIVDGVRTPFARAWTAYRDLGAADLGGHAVRGLLAATDLDPAEVDQLFWGCLTAPTSDARSSSGPRCRPRCRP